MKETPSDPILSDNVSILLETLSNNFGVTVGIIGLFLGILLATSGYATRFAFYHAGVDTSGDSDVDVDTGATIGKIENILVLGLMLLEAYTALGVIFAAKSIVRRADMTGGDTSYYLTGTLANFTYSVIISLVLYVSLWKLVN